MLVGSGVRNGGGPHRLLGAAGIQSAERAQWGQTGALRNISAGDARVSGITDREGFPRGVRHPVAWVLPQKAGSLTSYGEASGVGAATGLVAGGVNLGVGLAGVGTLTPDLLLLGFLAAAIDGTGELDATATALAVLAASLSGLGGLDGSLTAALSAVASLSGSGQISSADARAVLEAVAALSGTSTMATDAEGAAALQAVLTGSGVATADAIMIVNAVVDMNGSGSLASAVRAIGYAIVGIVGSGNASAAALARGFMSADIVVGAAQGAEVTPAEIAAAVWDAQTADLDTVGSIGERLRDVATPALVGAQIAAAMDAAP